MSKRICEWLFIINAFACVTACIAADVLGIAKLAEAGIVFAGTAVLMYCISRIS